jgi:hypothetical protein
MTVAQTRANLSKPRYRRRAMNAPAVAKLIRGKLGTLNAWIARGYFDGLEVGTPGKRRDIDPETALKIAVFAEMVTRFSIPPEAAKVAVNTQTLPRGWWLVPAPAQALGAGYQLVAHRVSSFDLIEEELQNLQTIGEPPASYVLINVDMLAERVRLAEEEWQQSRGGGKQP